MADPRELLLAFLEKHNLNHTQFGELAGLDRPIVSHYCAGTRCPGIAAAFKIEKATAGAISAKAWGEAAAAKKKRKRAA